MAEQEDKRIETEFGKKLIDILDDVLATGDWESSLFLKSSATKLQKLRAEIEKVCITGGVEIKTSVVNKDSKIIPPGYTQVFILLYQVDGANLQGWHRTIKNLEEYNVTRPAYKDESYAREFIRSKVASIDCNGYVVVNVKDDDIYKVDAPDAFGHQLFALREKAIQLENVFEFVHANKKRYVVRDNELVLF